MIMVMGRMLQNDMNLCLCLKLNSMVLDLMIAVFFSVVYISQNIFKRLLDVVVCCFDAFAQHHMAVQMLCVLKHESGM